MGNLIKVKQIAGGSNGQVLKTNSSGKSVWGTDVAVSGMTFNDGTYDLTINLSDGSSFTDNLGILSGDMVVTGGTYDINTGVVEFTNNSGGTFNVSGFSSGMTDTFVTSGSIVYADEAGTMTLTKNDATSFQVSGITDTSTTGATLNGDTVAFDTNAGLSAYTLDLSSLIDATPFEYATGSTSSVLPKLGANTIESQNYNSFIGGGQKNTIGDGINTGNNNIIVGGDSNTLLGYGSTVVGGRTNEVNATYYSYYNTVVGGTLNKINGSSNVSYSFIGGGLQNEMTSSYSFIGGGSLHAAGGEYSFIGGGTENTITSTGFSSVIGGGSQNNVSGNKSVIVGGNLNTVSGDDSSIIGGESNTVTHNNSHIIGSNITSISANTTHVEKLNIGTLNGTSSVAGLGIDANGMIVSAATATDIHTTGATLNGDTVAFDTNVGLSAYTLDLSSLEVNDTYVTGGTYDNSAAEITFTNNDTDTFTVDMSTMHLNDIFVTGGTVANGSLSLDMSDTTGLGISGGIVQAVNGDSPITASTTNGVVTVGLDYTSLQLAVQTLNDKNETPTPSSGNEFNTGIAITDTPVNGGYVTVQVNGVSYSVGDGVKTSDCYFTVNGAGGTHSARAIEDIVATDELRWNGNIVGFDLDADDNVALFYEILK